MPPFANVSSASRDQQCKRRDGPTDLFWKGVLLVEQKSAAKNLDKAKVQFFEYFPGLKEAELSRYILVSDFQNFEFFGLRERVEYSFKLSELPDHIELFGFVIGGEKRTFAGLS